LATKDIKLNIKNTQIAEAIKLGKLKEKLAKQKTDAKKKKEPASKAAPSKKPADKKIKKGKEKVEQVLTETEEAPRRKARTKSAFSKPTEKLEEKEEGLPLIEVKTKKEKKLPLEEAKAKEEKPQKEIEAEATPPVEAVEKVISLKEEEEPQPTPVEKEILGPTGKHIKDLLPPKTAQKKKEEKKTEKEPQKTKDKARKAKEKERIPEEKKTPKEGVKEIPSGKEKSSRFKEFRDVKPSRRQQTTRFDARDRHGLRIEEGQRWRKNRHTKQARKTQEELPSTRPTSLTVRIPIPIKELAAEMKIKASQLISKLFLQGISVTINDILDNETTIQLLGEEFDCEIKIDTSEEERIRITDKTIKEEVDEAEPTAVKIRAPVVTFMGHVDHGKTSLIDFIRKTNTVQAETGAITQHIGAFLCATEVGDIAILDTPGHEAFSAMRVRGADVTDIVVLVIAGDEGMRAQTEEAIEHAKAAEVTIIVAINKSDKPNFDAENVYRQLADHELLPEAWGGQTITVNCSAVTGEGVKDLLEMLALQAEVLELKANPNARARGAVIESELHKGLGAVATVLVQNGTLKIGDSVVFAEHWGRVKTMQDEFGKFYTEASPSTPIAITGLSGLPEAGYEFIVVPTEREAREIAEARRIDKKLLYMQQTKKQSMENLFQQAADKANKILKVVLRADVQGSLEALKAALVKIESDKVDIEIISSAVGEISESDVLLAAASKAIIIGFHIKVESHADQLVKQHGVHVCLHDVIYHAIDNVRELMTGLLDKLAQETDKGKAEVKATFKASQLGNIAGCLVTEGSIHRNHYIRVIRDGEQVWKGPIASLKRVKEDVREVQKGVESGIVVSIFRALLCARISFGLDVM